MIERWQPAASRASRLIGRLARRARRDRALGAAEAGHRRLAHRRLGAARQDGAGRTRASDDVEEIEEIWHGLTPPYTELFAWLDGQAERPEIGDPSPLPPADAGQPDRRAATSPCSTAPTSPPSGNGTASACSAVGRRAAMQPAVLAHRRRHRRRLPRPRRANVFERRARRRAAGRARRRGGALQRPAAAAEPQDASTPRCCSEFPASSASTTCCDEGDEDLRALPFAERRAASRPSWRERREPRASTCRRCVAVRRLGRARRAAPTRAPASRRRSRGDAEARRLALCAGRPKGLWFKWKRDPHIVDAVLMYAQRGHGKRSSLLFRLHVRRLARATRSCRSARPISASPTRS